MSARYRANSRLGPPYEGGLQGVRVALVIILRVLPEPFKLAGLRAPALALVDVGRLADTGHLDGLAVGAALDFSLCLMDPRLP